VVLVWGHVVFVVAYDRGVSGDPAVTSLPEIDKLLEASGARDVGLWVIGEASEILAVVLALAIAASKRSRNADSHIS